MFIEWVTAAGGRVIPSDSLSYLRVLGLDEYLRVEPRSLGSLCLKASVC